MTDANGLYYMRARYYDPRLKRFLNRDVIRGEIQDGQSFNRYAYVNGNPVSYIDPLGLMKCETGRAGNGDNTYKDDLQQIINNLDSTKGGALGNIDGSKFINKSFQTKIFDNVPDIDNYKGGTIAIIGHRDSIVPFQKTKGLDNRINVFKANNFGPGGWTAEKNFQWIKDIVENKQPVYFASQKLNVGDSWTREEIKYLLDSGYRQKGSYFIPLLTRRS